MRNYYDMLDDIMDTCGEIEDILGVNGAPIWDVMTYVDVMRIKHLAANIKVADGAEELAAQAAAMRGYANDLRDCYRRNMDRERENKDLERLYGTLRRETFDMMCEADKEYTEARQAERDANARAKLAALDNQNDIYYKEVV